VEEKEEKLSKPSSRPEVFFSSSEALRNISSLDNYERFDNVVELEEHFPKESHCVNLGEKIDKAKK